MENIYKFFSETIKWIEDSLKLGNVYVHSKNGKSRCAAFIVAYIAKNK